MKFAYADPPYLGCGKLYDANHSESRIWDYPDSHRLLVERLLDQYPSGWAMSLSSPSLKTILPMCPSDCRVMAWVKPFAIFKPNVGLAYAWEPVILRGGRKITREMPTVRDFVSANITLRKGLTGAKPPEFCEWILAALGFREGDQIDDLFPGTNSMQRAIELRRDLVDAMQEQSK